MAVDTAFLDKEYGEKITQRKDTFITALDLFSREFHKNHPDRKLICDADNASTEFAYLYFHWSHQIVKPFVKNLTDRFKIASCTEFCIIYLKPIAISGGTEAQHREINASFAFYLAINIMLRFDEEAENAGSYVTPLLNFKGGIAPLEDGMTKIIENHRIYIAAFDETKSAPPVVLNAFVWEMIHMFYQFQWQALAV